MNVLRPRETLVYDGSQLRSHWAYERFGVQGDVIVQFTGPAHVEGEALVDLMDRRQREVIRAAAMLHFITEHFDPDLRRAVLLQHLLVAIAAEVLSSLAGQLISRRGDDLYAHERKLSVSIATVSPVSALAHLGINVDPSGAPVPAIGLGELGVDPDEAGEQICERYAAEIRQVTAACSKVRWVP